MNKQAKSVAAILALVLLLSCVALVGCGQQPDAGKNDPVTGTDVPDTPDVPDEPAPVKPEKVEPLTLYVAVNGTAGGDGTQANPFATIEAARDYVRTLDKSWYSSVTVSVGAGTYSVRSLVFEEQDGGTATCPVTYKADGEVTLDAGVTFRSADFTAVTDGAVPSRLSEQAQKDVVCVDLSAFGIGPNDYGKIYAIGSYNTAGKYDGDWVGGQYAELFYNDERMSLARYPNEGWLNTGRVVEEGEGAENSQSNHRTRPDWDTSRNPKSDKYQVAQLLADRIATWQTLDDVWMFGYWYYDWADASSPVGYFNAETCELSPKFVSIYGAADNKPFYFFNVFEELDVPGEWYLDRDNAVLYLYPDGDFANASVSLSLATDTVVSVNTSYLTFDGFRVKGTRGDAIAVRGNDNVIENCLLKNIGGTAITVNGYRNLVYNNEITRTGKGGIYITGGDMATLTRGENVADNNMIHDWAEVYMTYQPAISLGGCGNGATHNEMYNSPHEAITYYGPYEMVKYNIIHDVCLLSSDAGAIYAGRNYTTYGSEICNNLLYSVGSKQYRANGIYTDDCLSGITIRNNVLVDVWGANMLIGGGRDMIVENNVMVRINVPYDPGATGWGVSYDQRGYDGATDPDSWFAPHSGKGGSLWTGLYASPWQTDIWKEAFPGLAKVSDDFNTVETNRFFAANPGCSSVKNNVGVGPGAGNNISAKAQEFSDVEELVTCSVDSVMRKAAEGDYSLAKNAKVFKENPDLQFIDLKEMGRQTK